MTQEIAQQPRSKKVLRFSQVTQKTGLPKSTVYRLISEGKFPRQFKLSERSSGFLESEIDDWLDSRADSRIS